MNIQTKKKLGEGVMGTVYLSDVNGQKCVTKIEKYEEVKTPLLSSYYRQLEFDNLAKQYPNKFLTLIQHGIIKNCSHQQKLPKEAHFPKDILNHLKEKNKLKDCYVLSYVPILEGTLNDVLLSLTRKQWIDCFIQLIESVNIMKTNGFYHRDLHGGNIMYIKKNNKYQWYIIDYGLIWRKTYPKNYDDKIMNISGNLVDCTDIMSLLWTLIKNPAFKYMIDKQIKFPPYNKFIKHIKNDSRYEKIKQMMKIFKYVNKYTEYYYIDVITILYYSDLWIDAIGLNSSKHKNLIINQDCPEIIIYVLKHLLDKNYTKIITYCKSKMLLI
jgi:serine/threonine protein kinase